jgi:alanine-glyoxylate transaminase/serine-glyoxylate transaminase/serine-pyruvate transaminase
VTKPYKLFIPGPVSVDDDVLDAMSQPVMRHYGPEWMEVYQETTALLKQVFQTQNDVFIVPGPGTAGLDMAMGSLLANSQKVIVCHNGFFGERLATVAEANGLNVVHVSASSGLPIAPDDLRQALREHPDASVVVVVHHETTTTVMNPVSELALAVREAGRVFVVDAVSSLGGVDVPVDAWGIDVCVTAVNKCLECPPGLALVSVSPRAWEMVNRHESTQHGWYLSLKTWRWYADNWGDWHPSPVTMPTNNIIGLRTSLRKIMAVGLPEHFAKHARVCRAVRAGLRNMGFQLFVPDEFASPLVTAVLPRPEFTAHDLQTWLAEERGLYIGGGIGELAGKILRIGHIGLANSRDYVMDLLFAIEEYLRLKGTDVPVGASLIGL